MVRKKGIAPTGRAAASWAVARPSIGEVRVHRQTGLLYMWEFNPATGAPQWLRRDTFVRGEWRRSPVQTARAAELLPILPARRR